MRELSTQIVFYVNSVIYFGMMCYGFTCLFKPAIRKIWFFLIYMMFALISPLWFFWFGSGWINLAFNTAAFLCIALLFKGKLSTRFIFSILLYILSIVADAMAFIGLSYAFYRRHEVEMLSEHMVSIGRTASNIIFVPLLLISTIFFRKIFKQAVYNSDFKIPLIYTISIFLLLAGIILISLRLILAEISNMQENLLHILTSQFIVLVVVFFVIWLYNILLDHLAELEQSKQKDMLLSQWEMQCKVQAEAQEMIAKTEHNLRYHFVMIQELARAKELAEIERYVSNELGEFSSAIDTGNMAIDATLNYYLHRIREILKINMEVDIQVPSNLALETMLVAMILGNALENATEACGYVPHAERYIHVRVQITRNGALLVIIENPYVILPVTDQEGNLLTTKKNKHKHGLGLSGIQELLPDESGSILIEYGDRKFQFKLLLYDVLEKNMSNVTLKSPFVTLAK